ncbi:MAG TPA: hypothetical protein VGP82_25520 [Ktedonobacterales bacterium]|jgi:hypothetical protein|nr:hypothetical protein [Ktedonobacterales bacterium]
MSNRMQNDMSDASQVLTRRPGLVTFAAVMLFIVAAFQLVFAMAEFFNAAWITGATYGTFGGYLWLWAILDVLLALIPLYAGYDLLQGGSFGFIVGIVLAGISAIRWFFYLPAQPILALVVIGVDILIIYGLTSSADYFRASSARATTSTWSADPGGPMRGGV